MKKLALAVCFGMGLVGCAAPKYNYQPKVEMISKPPIGTETTAYVGDQMLIQGKFVEQEALRLKQPARLGLMYTLLAGDFVKSGDDKGATYFAAVNNIPNGGGVTKSAIADPYKAVMLTKDGKLCVITIFNATSCDGGHEFSIEKIGVATEDSFQQTLIYSGRVGGKINVGYREFSSNMARPAFNNDVEYDLSESKEIGYKGALLEVIDATNQFIKYKVLRNFNSANQ